VQDGFQLYTHNFILSSSGKWAVVQQGMSDATSTARRYHWHSESMSTFLDDPHTFIYGQNAGNILNMADSMAVDSRNAIMQIAGESPGKMIGEISKLIMPAHHDVRAKDVDLKRLGAVLWLAHEKQPAAARKEFERAARLCRSNGLAGQLRSIEATLERLNSNR